MTTPLDREIDRDLDLFQGEPPAQLRARLEEAEDRIDELEREKKAIENEIHYFTHEINNNSR